MIILKGSPAPPRPVSGQPGPQQARKEVRWEQLGWGPTEINVKEGCVGTFHEDLFGGAVECLVHKVDAVSDHGSDPLSKALWGEAEGGCRGPGHVRPAPAPPDSPILPVLFLSREGPDLPTRPQTWNSSWPHLSLICDSHEPLSAVMG